MRERCCPLPLLLLAFMVGAFLQWAFSLPEWNETNRARDRLVMELGLRADENAALSHELAALKAQRVETPIDRQDKARGALTFPHSGPGSTCPHCGRACEGSRIQVWRTSWQTGPCLLDGCVSCLADRVEGR